MVGGEFASTVGNDGHDNVANTFVQHMSAVGIEEVRALVETSSHGDLLRSAESGSIFSFHFI